jgi:hypothetical protein
VRVKQPSFSSYSKNYRKLRFLPIPAFMSPYLIINYAVFIISFGCIYFIWMHLFYWGASISFGCIYFIWVHPFHLGVSILFGCMYFIWCVSFTVVVLTCFVICECAYVWGL